MKYYGNGNGNKPENQLNENKIENRINELISDYQINIKCMCSVQLQYTAWEKSFCG